MVKIEVLEYLKHYRLYRISMPESGLELLKFEKNSCCSTDIVFLFKSAVTS